MVCSIPFALTDDDPMVINAKTIETSCLLFIIFIHLVVESLPVLEKHLDTSVFGICEFVVGWIRRTFFTVAHQNDLSTCHSLGLEEL